MNEVRSLREEHKTPPRTIVTIRDVAGGGLIVNLHETRLLRLRWMESETTPDDQITALFDLDGRQEDIYVLKSSRGDIERSLHAAAANGPLVSFADDDNFLIFRCVDMMSVRISRPFIFPTRDTHHTVCKLSLRWEDGTEFEYAVLPDRAEEILANLEAALKRS